MQITYVPLDLHVCPYTQAYRVGFTHLQEGLQVAKDHYSGFPLWICHRADLLTESELRLFAENIRRLGRKDGVAVSPRIRSAVESFPDPFSPSFPT